MGALYHLAPLQSRQVLLKNTDGFLPLAPADPHGASEYKTIATVGIMDCMSAGYDSWQAGSQTKAPVKVMTDAALRKAFRGSAVTSGFGCRCPYGA